MRAWLRDYLDRATEERIALLLQVALAPRGRVHRTTAPPEELVDHQHVDLLDVADLAVQIKGGVTHEPVDPNVELAGEGLQVIELKPVSPAPLLQLDRILDDGGSVYRVDRHQSPPRLMRRADVTFEAALDQAAESSEIVGEHLRDAWAAAYSRTPNANAAYADAVRAVEVAISTVISPNNDRHTLGVAVRDLRNGAHKYELILLAKDGDGSVEPLLLLLERLWEGQKSRHGAGYGARPSTLEEARAAVQIAVLAVQWLTDGALRPRSTTGTS